jgi:protein CWC15
LPSQTTLKYRQAQGDQIVPPSNDFGEETREQLKARLARAEKDARNKKRKAQGLEPEPESASEEEVEEEELEEPEFKKPRTIERTDETSAKGKSRASESEVQDVDEGDESDAVDVDEDDEEDDEEIEARARAILKAQGGDGVGSEDEDEDASSGSEDDDDDDEDETAQLMKELEKIKAERAAAAAQKAREEEEAKEKREEEIAKGNPLLNDGIKDKEAFTDDGSSSVASFGVKRRWDDGEFAFPVVPQRISAHMLSSSLAYRCHLQESVGWFKGEQPRLCQ